MTVSIKRMILSAVMMTCVVIAADNSHYAKADSSEQSLITIDVFSKQFRLLKENKNESLIFLLPDNSIIEDKHSGLVLNCKKIEIRYNESFTVRCDDRVLSEPYDFAVKGEKSDAAFYVTINGEPKPREYSMPLTIRGNSRDIHCTVTESIMRYSRDCAASEYGFYGAMNSEAGEALALIIHSRSRSHTIKPLHDNAVFCDLTHCQHYRGRLLKDVQVKEPVWVIDSSTIKKGIFFHASCGGRTFGPEVFSNTSAVVTDGVSDRISDDGTWLCRDAKSLWSRELSQSELCTILYGSDSGDNSQISCAYDKKKMTVTVYSKQLRSVFAPEDFRLRINRVKGWNFMRSNNYEISEGKNGMIHFSGHGLGHGVGLCQNGAVSLAKRGYSRYEILQHYFKNISFKKTVDGAVLSPYLAYCRFNLRTGIVSESSYSNFLKRQQPTGSVFKVVVALYLVSQRSDIALTHKIVCKEKSDDPVLPPRCGNIKGHGEVTLDSALSKSCNYYFCSLYQKIDHNDFEQYIRQLFERYRIKINIPIVSGKREYAAFLAGLDHGTTTTVDDYAKIVRLLYSGVGDNEFTNKHTGYITLLQRQKIYSMLFETFKTGTASEKLIPHQPFSNFDNLADMKSVLQSQVVAHIFGKTSTLVSGTNSQSPYGLFIGGSDTSGIVTIIRHGNGNLAAQQSRYILEHNATDNK